MPHPNLFIVGAGKCGTTSLFSYLAQHPQIFPSPVKEPHYFSLGVRTAVGPWGRVRHVKNYAVYMSLFENWSGQAYIMEASASYIFYPWAAQEIGRQVPEARILIMLRDPVERAFSDFRLQRRNGVERLSFEETVEREQNGGRGYLSQGLYAGQVERYLRTFGRSRVYIGLFERFFADSRSSLSALCRWLAIDDDFDFDVGVAHNVGSDRIPYPGRLYALSRSLGRLAPFSVRQLCKALVTQRVTLDAKTRSSLQDYYRSDVLRLSALIDADLSCWTG